VRAAVWYGRQDVRVETVPELPPPGPREVKISVRWCGICGTDMHEYWSGPKYVWTGGPHPLTGRMAPLTLGHELSGDVVQTGEEARGVRTGDRVTVDPAIYCGECYWCRRNQYAICEKVAGVGLCCDGGFATYVTVPDYCVYKLPVEVSYEVGALIEPLAAAIHGVRRGRVMEGDSVVVLGAGPLGLCALQSARAAGASQVFVIETLESRRELARQLGASLVLDPTRFEVDREVFDKTNGIGADVGIECVGGTDTVHELLATVRKGGRVVVLGVFGANSEIDFNRLVFGEREVVGSLANSGEFAAAIALLMDGRIRLDSLITSKIGLTEIVEKGFLELARDKERQIKILVSPDF
jgi:(R,R)-butanediol dehydrogenase / meso-butanediol dehydrogenase / diacetyl reductase